MTKKPRKTASRDRKSTRLNSSHTVIYTLSLHDALPISLAHPPGSDARVFVIPRRKIFTQKPNDKETPEDRLQRSEEHTSELQSHSDLHSFPTRRSSDLTGSPPRK